MGCMKLRELLKHKVGSLSVAAKQVNIDLTRMYDLTSRQHNVNTYPPTFTNVEKQAIMNMFFAQDNLTEGDVFEDYENTNHGCFYEVSEGVARRRRRR